MNNNYDAFRTFIEGRFGFGGGQSMKLSLIHI